MPKSEKAKILEETFQGIRAFNENCQRLCDNCSIAVGAILADSAMVKSLKLEYEALHPEVDPPRIAANPMQYV